MLVYDFFAGPMDWHPRIVDELTLEELFWLPVVREAKRIAAEQLSDK